MAVKTEFSEGDFRTILAHYHLGHYQGTVANFYERQKIEWLDRLGRDRYQGNLFAG
jgi:hypothetical protein